MRKKLAWLLILCMTLQLSSATVYAEEEGAKAPELSTETVTGEQEQPEVDTPVEDGGPEEAPEAETAGEAEQAQDGVVDEEQVNTMSEPEEKLGNVAVELACSLPIADLKARLERVKVVLYHENTEAARGNLAVSGKEDGKASVEFKGLAEGNYRLELAGVGFAYSQNIDVQAMNQQIRLVDRTAVIDKEAAHPGTYIYGDINEDGALNETDRALLLEALSAAFEEAVYDINGDGKVDLADLQCFTYSYGTESTEATVVRTALIDEAKVEAEVGQGTQLASEGSVKDVLTGAGSISVKPASDKVISKDNPVEISFDLSAQEGLSAGGITIAPVQGSENTIKEGSVEVTYEDVNGEEQTETLIIGGNRKYLRTRAAAAITQEPDGTLVVNLGNQVAIKKITIKVTDTGSTKLADIGKVEFLNDMESRIPAPVMNVPEKLAVTPGNKKFTLTWDAQQNVSGYEVEITYEGKTVVVPASVNRLTVTSFGNDKLKNKEVYRVRVQSVNGEWSSGYSDAVDAVPVADKAPDAPENVSIKGGYRLLDVSWKKMEDTDYYTLYYRVKGEGEYQKVEKITKTSCRLTDLETKKTYEVYLTGTNECGTSGKSVVYIGTTIDIEPPVTSNYKLINTDNGVGNATAHITKVEYPHNRPENEMTVVDNDYTSSWSIDSWDAGGYNSGKPSPIVEFDQAYEMNRITIIPDAGQQGTYAYCKTRYWDESGSVNTIDGFLTTKTSSNGKIYYELWFDKPFTAKKVQVNLAQYWVGNKSVSIAEMKFYYYDSLDEEVGALYADSLHLTLAEGVTKEQIKALEERANTKDEVSGEYHPRRELLLREIENAGRLLADENLSAPIQVDTSIIKSKDNVLKIASGLNSWQPLGVSAHEGEELAVYVGRPNTAIGANTQVRLIASQYHAESGNWNKVIVANLKQGQNIVVMPAISSLDVEHGGSLYVEFIGTNSSLNIQVRVSGGTRIPMLDLSRADGEAEKRAAVTAYVEELNAYVPKLKEMHDSQHLNQDDSHCNYKYDKQNCILGATEIVLDKVMYSVSAEQILKGISSKAENGSVEEQAEVLYQSLEAMEQMVTLFYQHKGLTDQAVPENYGAGNSFPVSRLNIRYMRMFAGAFMYAGGLHIGIEWGSIPGLAKSQPVVSDNGKYVSGQLFGWGIAHEIGHIINQPDYAIAEITNNYFSILAQADETNDKVRFKYADVYEKVTSGTKGRASSVFTSLAMYWQLHLAYDNGYNYKTYEDYSEQFDNLFFARVDAYARNTSIAPGGLSLAGADTDNKFMRLSCAAAGKNLLTFFEKWGMTPNEDTIAYASQFPQETRNICYITDEARVYRIEGGGDVASGSTVNVELQNETNSKQVTLKLSNTAADQSAMLGYEIYRNGQVIGFAPAEDGETLFTDTIATINNRVFTYEVVGYDKLLNTTEKAVTEPIKISHDGSVAKNLWSATTNMTSPEDVKEEGSDENPEPEPVSAIDKIYNDDYGDSYIGTSANEPQLTLQFNETIAAAGMKITAPKGSGDAIKKYEVYVSDDNSQWELAKSGTLSYDDGTAVVYFSKEDDSWMYTYDASYLKLVVKGQKKVEISEIDILGPAGDNVELLRNGIGILKTDYVLDENAEGGSIPAGSLIFTGEYKGNPAYNAVKLYNQNNEIIAGTQIIFAEVPAKGELGEISSGTWIYYIEPQKLAEMEKDGTLPRQVRAELYRVDNAQNNKGERLVSDTLWTELPETLPEIELQDNK